MRFELIKPTNMKIQNLFLVILIVFISSCQTTEINSDFDNKIDFSSYHSFSICLDDFQISSYAHPEYDNEKMKVYFKEAIESEMRKYYTSDEVSPELHVGVNIKIEDKKFTYRSCDNKDIYHEWPECRMKTFEYTEGTLLVYVADVSKKQIIWQASLSGMTKEDLIENKKVINRIVENLFQTFPLHKKEMAS